MDEKLLKHLQDNHFYPSVLKSASKTAPKITGLMIDAPTPYLMETKKKRLQEILEGHAVKVVEKEGYLVITKKKVS